MKSGRGHKALVKELMMMRYQTFIAHSQLATSWGFGTRILMIEAKSSGEVHKLQILTREEQRNTKCSCISLGMFLLLLVREGGGTQKIQKSTTKLQKLFKTDFWHAVCSFKTLNWPLQPNQADPRLFVKNAMGKSGA